MALLVADAPKLCSHTPGTHFEPEHAALLLPDDVLASILSLLPQRQRCGGSTQKKRIQPSSFTILIVPCVGTRTPPPPPLPPPAASPPWQFYHWGVLQAGAQGTGRAGVPTLGERVAHLGLSVGVCGAVTGAAWPAHPGGCCPCPGACQTRKF